jgi:hypothetical protein
MTDEENRPIQNKFTLPTETRKDKSLKKPFVVCGVLFVVPQ